MQLNYYRKKKVPFLFECHVLYLAGAEWCQMWSQFFSDHQIDGDQAEHGRLAHTALTVVIALHNTPSVICHM